MKTIDKINLITTTNTEVKNLPVYHKDGIWLILADHNGKEPIGNIRNYNRSKPRYRGFKYMVSLDTREALLDKSRFDAAGKFNNYETALAFIEMLKQFDQEQIRVRTKDYLKEVVKPACEAFKVKGYHSVGNNVYRDDECLGVV